MTIKKRPLLRSDLQPMGGLDLAGLRSIAQEYPAEFMARTERLIAEGKITLRMIPDLKAFFRAFHDVQVKASILLVDGARAALDTSAFPLLMGNLVVAEINRAYEAVATIGQELVTDMESNKKFTHIAQINHLTHKNLETKEGDEFPLISAGEQFVVIGHKRKGFQIAISQETLEENDIGNFIQLVDQGAEFAAEVVEEQTLDRVTDRAGSANAASEPYVFRPNGTGTALYSATGVANSQTPSGTRVINNPLTTTSNLDAIRTVLAAMKNSRGRRISIPMSETDLVVPDALAGIAAKLLNSELEPGVANEINNWGPRGRYRPRLITSPKLDDISTGAFYMGAFRRQFVRKWKLRLETVSVYADAMQFLRTREAYRARVAFDVEVGARDNVFVVQSLPGTVAATAPTAATS